MTERHKKHGTDDLDATGLPVEPERRRAAVVEQFDDFKARLAALDEPAPTDVDRYRAALAHVENELLAVLHRHVPRLGTLFMAYACINLTAAVCAEIVHATPDAAADLDKKLGELRLMVAATNGTRQ